MSIKHSAKDLRDRLTSRKWILAVLACVFFATKGPAAYDNITQIVIAFLAVQAATDFAQQWTGQVPSEPSPIVPSPTEEAEGPFGD